MADRPIFKSNGSYLGFVSNDILYSRDGIYLGWIEGNIVFDSTGTFHGIISKINEYWYIIRPRFAMPPIPRPPRPFPFKDYKKWAQESGEYPITKRRFGEQLLERGYKKNRGTGGTWLWQRLKLKETGFE